MSEFDDRISRSVDALLDSPGRGLILHSTSWAAGPTFNFAAGVAPS